MLQLNETANGNQIELDVGQIVEIHLPENRTTGFQWNMVSDGTPTCSLLNSVFELTSGNVGDHRWQFQAMQAGLAKIELAYRRPWEQDKNPARSFTLNIHVLG